MHIFRFILLFRSPSRLIIMNKYSYRVRHLASVQSLVRVAHVHYLTGRM